MSSSGENWLSAKCIQTTLCKFDFNVCSMTKDEYLFEFPLTFPVGPDWNALDMEKFKINNLSVKIRPYYNFTTPASREPGYISGDFPIRVSIFSGNTVGEQAKGSKEISFPDFISNGKYVLGSAYGGVSADFGSIVYKTQTSEKVDGTTADDILKLSDFVNKENTQSPIDAGLLTKGRTILQKGRIVLAIRKDDLVGNLVYLIGDKEQSNGASRRILHRLASGQGQVQDQEPEGKKRGKKGGNPNEEKLFYPDQTIKDESNKDVLKVDYTFYIEETYSIQYTKNSQ